MSPQEQEDDEPPDWDQDELEESPPPPPPPLPARGAHPQEEAREASPAVLEMGPPPADALGAAKWGYQLQMRLAHEAMTDARLTPTQRRKEVRVTLAGAAKLMTDAARFDALETIREDRNELERKRANKAGAKLERVAPPPASAKVIPIRNGKA